MRAAPAPRARPVRGLWLTVVSGGTVLWRTLRLVLAVARQAPVTAPGARWLLVPGFRLRQGELGRSFAQRIERAHVLWQQDRTRGFVLSGAAARPDARSEADAALEHLVDLGLPHQVDVRLDRSARSTLENLQRTVELLGRDSGTVVVVSNRYHLARIAWLARSCGLDWRLCAAEPAWRWHPLPLLAALREAAVLVAIAGCAPARTDPSELLQPRLLQRAEPGR